MDEPDIVSEGGAEPPLFRQLQSESVDNARRLNRLLDRVRELMIDGRWRTLRQIAEVTGGSEAGVSARLRELRRPAHGEYTVERDRVRDGLWRYRVIPKGGDS